MSLWQLLWRLWRYAPGLYLVGTVLSLLGAVLLVAPAFISRAFFDALTGQVHLPLGIYQLSALLVAIQALAVGLNLWSAYTTTTAMMTTKALLRKNLIRHVLARSNMHALPESSGEAISRLRDDVDYAEGVLSQVIQRLGQMVYGVVAFLIMFHINARITVVIVIPLLLVTVLVQQGGGQLVTYRQRNRTAAARVTGLIGEIFGAVQAIKLANAEPAVIDHLRHLNAGRRQAALRDRVESELFRAVSANAVTVGMGAVLLLAAASIKSHAFSIGDFALFAVLLGSVSSAIPAIAGLLTFYRQATVSLDRLVALLGGAPGETMVQYGPVYLSGEAPAVPFHHKVTGDCLQRLEGRGLTYHHPGSIRGIEGIDLTLERGSLTVITGQVGAGKSTLLRVLLGLLPLESGEVWWNSQMVLDPAAHFVPPRSAFTPQAPYLFSETIRDNILLGLPEREVDLAEALDRAVLAPEVAGFDQQLDTVLGPRGIRLSGGQRQRAAAARMFVTQAELLVVDDLSSALDVETEQCLWERLLRQRDATILAVSHRRSVLRQADQIVVLKDGRAEATGVIRDLLEQCAEMRLIWSGRGIPTP